MFYFFWASSAVDWSRFELFTMFRMMMIRKRVNYRLYRLDFTLQRVSRRARYDGIIVSTTFSHSQRELARSRSNEVPCYAARLNLVSSRCYLVSNKRYLSN